MCSAGFAPGSSINCQQLQTRNRSAIDQEALPEGSEVPWGGGGGAGGVLAPNLTDYSLHRSTFYCVGM